MKKYTFLLFVSLLAFGFSPLTAQQWTGADNTTSSISRTGRVGIGVDVPLQTLHIGGNMRMEGNAFLFGANARLTKEGVAGLSFRSDHPTNSQFNLRDSTNVSFGKLIGYRTVNGNIFAVRDSENRGFLMSYTTPDIKYTSLQINSKNVLTARIYDEDTDEESRRIGINTNSPRQALDVRGSAIIDHLYVNTTSSGGFDTDDYKMFVDGKAAFEEVRVQLSQNWGDYVFAPGYDLLPLADLRSYINTNGHLPTMPSAKEIGDGIEVSDIVHRQMVAIEELTLHTLNQQSEIDELKAQVQQLIQALKAAPAKEE